MNFAHYAPHMQHAIALATQSRWQTAPNPPVGAVVVHNDIIVAEGWHHKAGQPHAEIEAINQARERQIPLAECTLVVTLEPCNHQGQTPPCTTAILEAQIPKVVIGTADINPEAGGGAERLMKAGVDVVMGVEEQACRDLIDNFVIWQTSPYPYTLIKLACTLDGRIATRTGNSQWISGPESRQEVHALRRDMDAIVIGAKTFFDDNPRLTCRLPDTNISPEEQPLAVIVSSRLPEAGANYHLLVERPHQTMFWTTVAAAASPKAEALRKLGVTITGLPSLNAFERGVDRHWAKLDLNDGMKLLRQEWNCHHVLCEGGGKLALTLIKSNLAHELHLHISPKIIADNDATPLFDGLSPDTIDEAVQLRFATLKKNDCDIIATLKFTDSHKENKGS